MLLAAPLGWLTHSVPPAVARLRRGSTEAWTPLKSGCPPRVFPGNRDRRWPVITIGIDPHKSSLTAVALEPSGVVAATIRLEVTGQTVPRLQAWAQRWDQRQWAVEGAAGLGRGVAQGLAAAG